MENEQLKQFCTEQDFIKIASTLINEFPEYDFSDMEIKIGINGWKLEKLDKYLFNKYNNRNNINQFNSNNEVILNISKIKFVLYKNGDKIPEIKIDEFGNEFIE